jgi:hypothetical protein
MGDVRAVGLTVRPVESPVSSAAAYESSTLSEPSKRRVSSSVSSAAFLKIGVPSPRTRGADHEVKFVDESAREQAVPHRSAAEDEDVAGIALSLLCQPVREVVSANDGRGVVPRVVGGRGPLSVTTTFSSWL